MKKDIHPQYHLKTKAKCACGNTFSVGSTREKIEIEVCSKCHPFYTGEKQLLDTAGRAEKFEKRRAKAQTKTPSKTSLNKTRSKRGRKRNKK